MRGRNVTKSFSIAGFILGEIYMLFTVLAPQNGGPAPVDFKIWAVLSAAIFFGPLGALVGTGVGLLLTALLGMKPKLILGALLIGLITGGIVGLIVTPIIGIIAGLVCLLVTLLISANLFNDNGLKPEEKPHP